MANKSMENAFAALRFARTTLLSLFEDFPRDKVCHQLTPGGNHALWILGHIALEDDVMMTMLGRKQARCPAEWAKLFGMGSTPVGQASHYPKLDELLTALADRREEFIAWLGSRTDAQLAEPLPKELIGFAPNAAALASSLAWHDGLHTGQLTMLRRDLGMKPKYG